ncbi:MAG TPA: hypothetical protein VM370_10145 [Candidatus Thermoplasmatota archaeon]|nr:hypothetical protein [Candidatus Thermoplasmatota archaeon]
MAIAVEDVLRLAVSALSVLVFSVGVTAYLRRPTGRMLLVLLLFFVFLVQGALLFFEVFFLDTPITESIYYLFQLVEIALVASIILKR